MDHSLSNVCELIFESRLWLTFLALSISCLRLDCDIFDCTWLLAVLCEVGNKNCKYMIVRNLNKLATKK